MKVISLNDKVVTGMSHEMGDPCPMIILSIFL